MGAIQALQQRTRQFGAFFRAKGEGALQQFSGVVRHGIIIRPESGYGPEVTGKNREPVAPCAYGRAYNSPHVPLVPPGIAKAESNSEP